LKRSRSSYTLSEKASADIAEIAHSSAAQWGMERAERYIVALHQTCLALVDYPDTGRDARDIRHGYMRIESGSHVIFYLTRNAGVLVIRLLHQRMDFMRHL
jgi:toxin ParE1/3/4